MSKRRYGLLGAGLGLLAGGWYAARRRWTRPAPPLPFPPDAGLIVFAHRGGAGCWPPNTLLAFQNAVEMGVDALELDIHSTADGVLVVRHDPTVDATTDGSGPIQSFTLEELRKLDAGYTWTADGETHPFRGQGLGIPTLEEVFLGFPEIPINIDIKQRSPSIVEDFCALLRRYDRAERTVVGSFHRDTLAHFRRACPETPTAVGPQETRMFWALNRVGLARLYRPPASAFQVPEYSDGTQVVDPSFVRAAHHHGIAVHIWTVDEEADMQRLIEMGVDGLMTDYPGRLLNLLGRREAEGC